MWNERRAQKRNYLVVLGVSRLVKNAQRMMIVVMSGTATSIDFRRWFRVANWQFVSRLGMKTRMYQSSSPCRLVLFITGYPYLQCFSSTSRLLCGLLHSLFVVGLNFSTYLFHLTVPTWCAVFIVLDGFLDYGTSS